MKRADVFFSRCACAQHCACNSRERRPELDWEQLETAATELKRKLGLDFPRYVRRIALNWKLRLQPVFV